VTASRCSHTTGSTYIRESKPELAALLGGVRGSAEALQLQTKIMHPGSEWEVIGISHVHWRMLATALVLGGNIRTGLERTGLEDHLYLPSGQMAKSNGELVAAAEQLCRSTGRKPATVDQAREILSLAPAA